MIVVDGHVRVIANLEVSYLLVVDVILVDLLGNDEEPHIVLLLQHDLHLVQDELQLLPAVHRTVGLHLHFLQDARRLQDVAALLPFHDQQHAPCVLHLRSVPPTSRKIFLPHTSRMASMSLVRWGSGVADSQVMASWTISTCAFLDCPRRLMRKASSSLRRAHSCAW
jgi:hypothetical protein